MMGGPLAAVSKLTSAGLSMDQIKALGNHHARLCQGEGGRPARQGRGGLDPRLSGYV